MTELKIKRFTPVHVHTEFDGFYQNPIQYVDAKGNFRVGARVSDGKRPAWWYVVREEDFKII